VNCGAVSCLRVEAAPFSILPAKRLSSGESEVFLRGEPFERI
jgi:hypothetical protein